MFASRLCPPHYTVLAMKQCLSLLLYSALVLSVWAQSREQCQVYYGGLVFPEGSKKPLEHGMHWSKTQSEFGGRVG